MFVGMFVAMWLCLEHSGPCSWLGHINRMPDAVVENELQC